MSRSRKKVGGVTFSGTSQKKGKTHCHRKFRSKQRQAMHNNTEPPVRLREVTDPYDLGGDGKAILNTDKAKRK